jgi:hypothetical protein
MQLDRLYTILFTFIIHDSKYQDFQLVLISLVMTGDLSIEMTEGCCYEGSVKSWKLVMPINYERSDLILASRNDSSLCHVCDC